MADLRQRPPETWTFQLMTVGQGVAEPARAVE